MVVESSIKPKLVDLTSTPDAFFSILPEDWQEDIAPRWSDYTKEGARIYGFKFDEKVVAGGIVFETVSPDIKAYEMEANKLFDAGMSYFAFLWVSPVYRNEKLGSLWISEVKKKSVKPLWLSIDDFALASFYLKNGFILYKEVLLDQGSEWIMIPEGSNLL